MYPSALQVSDSNRPLMHCGVGPKFRDGGSFNAEMSGLQYRDSKCVSLASLRGLASGKSTQEEFKEFDTE